MELVAWRQHLLSHFDHKDSALLLVIDPDDLLCDDALLAEIENRNFDVLELQEEVAFRNQFERSYRSRWDAGEARHVVVIVHTTDQERSIPYDLWQKSRRIELSVATLFPHLNAIVVAELDNAYYAALYQAHQQLVNRQEMRRSEAQTVEFILRAVFTLDPLAEASLPRLVELLIQKHQRRLRLPQALQNHLQMVLLPRLGHWGLRPAFVEEEAAFFAWLDEQWQAYLLAEQGEAAPPPLDCADLRLRAYWSALFTQGLLPRRPARRETLRAGREWAAVGLLQDETFEDHALNDDASERRLYHLRARLTHLSNLQPDNLPTGKSDLRDWLNLAAEWAEVVYTANRLPGKDYAVIRAEFAEARRRLDEHFWSFVQERYSAIDHYQDNKGPISLAAVNRWLYQHVKKAGKLALLCFDGMALDQWRVLRAYLERHLPGLVFQENCAYAPAPTITSIARQALFAGRPPAGFAETLFTTGKDAERWKAFWVNHDVSAARVAHLALKAAEVDWSALQPLLETKQRLGLQINLFDEVMHATAAMPPEADKRIYYATLNSHLQHSQLVQVFDRLLQSGFRLWVTADHGNLMGIGCGLTPPKALAESYARRVVIFDQALLAQEYAQERQLRYFRTKSLPADVHPVYLPGSQMLDSLNATRITHGGLSLEELIAPFVEVSRP